MLDIIKCDSDVLEKSSFINNNNSNSNNLIIADSG
jgi:hypothetical protein